MASGRRRFLGRTIGGRVTLLAARFDPKAEDGDGDGMVQDGTQWQRPAVASAIARRISNARGNGRNRRQINKIERRRPSSLADLFRKRRSDLDLDVPEVDIPGRPKEGYRDAAVTPEQIIDLRVKIKKTVKEKFGDISNGQKAKIALKKAFPNADLTEVDFGSDTKELNPNERSAVETLLFLSLNNPNLNRSLRKITIKDPRNTDEYREALREFVKQRLLQDTPNFDIDKMREAGLVLDELDAKIDRLTGFQSGAQTMHVGNDDTYGSELILNITGNPESFLPHSYDDRSEITENYLQTISINEYQQNWHPENKAIIKINESLKRSNIDNQKRIDTIDELRAMSLVLHEWGHHDHTTTVMEKEFGFTEWGESAEVQQEKLFSIMTSDDKAFLIYTALVESRIWNYLTNFENYANTQMRQMYDAYDAAMKEGDIQKEMVLGLQIQQASNDYQIILNFVAQRMQEYRLMSQMAHNSYGNDELRDDMFKQLDVIKQSLKQFGIDLEPLEKSAWMIVDTMDKDHQKTLKSFKDDVGLSLLQMGVNEDEFEKALRLVWNHKFAQKLLDSLSDEEAKSAISRLPKVSNYAGTTYNMWTAGTIDWMNSAADMISYSIQTAILEGIAELFKAKMFGYKTPFEGPEAMMAFLQTKQAKVTRKKTKKTDINIDINLEAPSDRPEYHSSCNTKFFEKYVEPDDKYAEAIKASKDLLKELAKKPFKFDEFTRKDN